MPSRTELEQWRERRPTKPRDLLMGDLIRAYARNSKITGFTEELVEIMEHYRIGEWIREEPAPVPEPEPEVNPASNLFGL